MCKKKKDPKVCVKNENITSFEKITLRLSGMRYTYEYEITNDGNVAKVALYQIVYGREEDRRNPEKSAETEIPVILQIVNDIALMKWDGFSGAHPKNVSDGEMFTLNGVVNGDRKIYASGSENFPKHYHEFKRSLNDILTKGKAE